MVAAMRGVGLHRVGVHVAGFLLFGLLAGCGSSSSGTTDDAIQEGTRAEPGEFGAVGVAVREDGKFCTATLIAEDIVLTAYHCLSKPMVAFYLGDGAPNSSEHPADSFAGMRRVGVD